MSRRELTPLHPRHQVAVGWDPPLASFFLQVTDQEISEEEADPVIVWMGADGIGMEPDVDRILDEAAKWAVVPDDLRDQLLLDQRFEGTRTEIAGLPILVLFDKRR